MKPLAYTRHKYSAEFYKFVRNTVGTASSISYYFVGNIFLTAGLAKTGQLTIRSDQPVAIGSLIANIKDSNGNLILDDTIWQISGLEPILNAFNGVEGYRMKAVKYQGTI